MSSPLENLCGAAVTWTISRVCWKNPCCRVRFRGEPSSFSRGPDVQEAWRVVVMGLMKCWGWGSVVALAAGVLEGKGSRRLCGVVPCPEEEPGGRGLPLWGSPGRRQVIPGHPETHLLPVSAPRLAAGPQVRPRGCGARGTWRSLSSRWHPLCALGAAASSFQRCSGWLGPCASRGPGVDLPLGIPVLERPILQSSCGHRAQGSLRWEMGGSHPPSPDSPQPQSWLLQALQRRV